MAIKTYYVWDPAEQGVTCERCHEPVDAPAFRACARGPRHHMCLACIEKGMWEKRPELADEVMDYFRRVWSMAIPEAPEVGRASAPVSRPVPVASTYRSQVVCIYRGKSKASAREPQTTGLLFEL